MKTIGSANAWRIGHSNISTTSSRRSTMALVRMIIYPLLFIVGLSACSKHNELKPTALNAELQQRLVGTWKLSKDFTNGNTFESSVTVTSNGTYVCDLSSFSRTYYKGTHIEGRWEIKDGFLIDTMTLSTAATNTHMPIISREKIIRLATNELVLRHDFDQSNFVESSFHKEKSN